MGLKILGLRDVSSGISKGSFAEGSPGLETMKLQVLPDGLHLGVSQN